MERCSKILLETHENVQLALGCTEPVAVGYLACSLKKQLGGVVERMTIATSEGIYKNGKGVYIPGTSLRGLDYAGALGVSVKNAGDKLLVFKNVSKDEIDSATAMVEKGIVSLTYVTDVDPVYVKITMHSKDDEVMGILMHAHDEIVYMEKNGQVIFEKEETTQAVDDAFNVELNLQEIMDFVESVPYEKIAYLKDGVDVNFEAANVGLSKQYGLMSGKHVLNLMESGKLGNDVARKTRILTSAAADMRMGGGPCAIMTSGGSGNQGIGIVIPIATVANENDIEQERMVRALLFGHLMNQMVKHKSGKLSGMCGCAIGSAIGATAAITWMLGGSESMIVNACLYIFANLSGMLCDGAKTSCALKLGTSAEEAVIASFLALDGLKVERNVGVIGSTLEDTIVNIGKLSNNAYPAVNDELLKIMED